MSKYVRIFIIFGTWAVVGCICIGALISGGYYYVAPDLPLAEELRDVRPQIPLSIYSRDGRLIAQFGNRRSPVPYEDIPPMMVQAVLAAEDDRFFEHPGIDYQGILRALWYFVINAGDSAQGGSTITQQIARQEFLTRDRTLARKFKEWILAVRIEREFSKDEILDIYLNTTFLGQRSWGVAAAAQTYFGKDLSEISLSDAAIIAGIPRGPSINNPFNSPVNATQQRAYVLRRMRELNFISDDESRVALATPIEGKRFAPEQELKAPYVAEMVRAEVLDRFGPDAYITTGLKVTTTIDSRLQMAADEALWQSLINYDERHGYRGPLTRITLPEPLSADHDVDEISAALTEDQQREMINSSYPDAKKAEWRALLEQYAAVSGFRTGLVVDVQEILSIEKQLDLLAIEAARTEFLDEAVAEEEATEIEEPVPVFQAQVYFGDLGIVLVDIDAVAWAAPYVNENRRGAAPKTVADVLRPGDIVRFRLSESGELRLGQVPEVQGALASLDPLDGAISALSGGFDFSLSKYNRATQSKRQPGSAFKPFVYSAALEKGFTAASIFNDVHVVVSSQALEGVWRPENYSGRVSGPTRLREALVKSLNLVSIRIVQRAGMDHTVQHVKGFGFDDAASPRNLTLALGSGGVAPLDLVRGYAAFANGGFLIEPYIIEKIEDVDGTELYAASPKLACMNCDEPEESEPLLIQRFSDIYAGERYAPRAINAQNAYLMNDMMQDVVRRGTGARAYRELGRTDLRGKTGTTNNQRDAWFAGFNGDVVAATWVGFDEDNSLGNLEQGARTALPMWISFMREALDGMPSHAMERPPGIVDVRINPENGLATSTRGRSIFEKFRMEHIPKLEQTRPELLQGVITGDSSESDRPETAGPGSIF